MTQLYIYEPEKRAFCLYAPEDGAWMPGMRYLPFAVSDFLYLANTDIAWTHRAALDALDLLCAGFGAPFSVDLAFRTAGRCTRTEEAQHFAGLAFEVGRGLLPKERARLYHAAVQDGRYFQASPPYLSGRSIRLYATCGLPALHPGMVGVHVFTLQSILQRSGLFFGALTGRYCTETERSVRRMQARGALPVTGSVLALDWHKLLALTNDVPDAKID